MPLPDEACLQRVLGALLTSKSLRERLLAQGISALRQDEQWALEITPGAWQALAEVGPRTCADLAFALEQNQARHSTLRRVMLTQGQSDAA